MRFLILTGLLFLLQQLSGQETLTVVEDSEIHVSSDTLCVDENVEISYQGSLIALQSWSFGEGAIVEEAQGVYNVAYTTPGTKQINLSIEGGNEHAYQLFVESAPEAKLMGSIASGFASVFHYGLALESSPIEGYQTAEWFIKSGETTNTGFVGDKTKAKVGFYNFDYTTKTVCRKVESNSGACVSDEACVQLTRYDCTCPIPIERDREVCISDTQIFVQENCCINPVPEIGDTTYWDSQNNTPFTKISPISIITEITKPGNYKYTFHYKNDILDQVENFEGDFNVKVKNKTVNVEISQGDSIGTCDRIVELSHEGSEEGYYSWILSSGQAALEADQDKVKVSSLHSPSIVDVALELDNQSCAPVYDTTQINFVGVYPEVNDQSVAVTSENTGLQLFPHPTPVEDEFEGVWSSLGVATIDEDGHVNNLVLGENTFYYTIFQKGCPATVDSVIVQLSPVVTSISQSFEEGVAYFPNPVKDQLHVELLHTPFNNIEIEVFDLMGNLVHSEVLHGIPIPSIDFNTFKTGVYVVSVNYNGTSSQFRVVK